MGQRFTFRTRDGGLTLRCHQGYFPGVGTEVDFGSYQDDGDVFQKMLDLGVPLINEVQVRVSRSAFEGSSSSLPP
jgi:hypothetical protein